MLDSVGSADTALVHEVVGRVRRELPAMVDHITGRMFAEIPFYRGGGAGTVAEVRARLRVNLEAGLSSLLGVGHAPGPPAETGRLRAGQDAPLADVLCAYRLGYLVLSNAVVRAGAQAPAVPAEIVIELLQALFRNHGLDADAMVDAYREEAHYLMSQRERERAAYIDVLVSEDPGLATLLEVARALRLPVDGAFLAIATVSDRGQDPMPRVVSALAAIDVTMVWRIRYDTAVGVLSVRNPARADQAMAVLRRHTTGPVGVSPVFGSLRQTAWALGLAELVRDGMPGAPTVEQFENTPLNVLVAGGRDAARTTARTVLGGLLDAPGETQRTLLATLREWVAAAGSADRTAQRLHCHPNTVRKRLRRLEELTGRSLAEPGGIAELVTACHAWTQLRR
ncbi:MULTISPECIES: PucR family transcriptional regulator [unclassified Nocardia]|uniref:PucR family transcriptional regulator n=1 Tax=unclassified Nocardia TaxID=2637762 RepID=UPI0033AF1E93